jgi:hypothetical protein
MHVVPTRSLALLTLVALVALAAASGCGGSEDDGGAPPVDNGSILGAGAATYAEASEAANGAEAASEVTGYTLDATGLRITGAFEAGSATADAFRFGTGPFTHVDVQLFVNGVKQAEANYTATLTLNSFVNDGYSTLMGNGYFINAWLSGTNKDYVVVVHPGAAGATYVLELKGR